MKESLVREKVSKRKNYSEYISGSQKKFRKEIVGQGKSYSQKKIAKKTFLRERHKLSIDGVHS